MTLTVPKELALTITVITRADYDLTVPKELALTITVITRADYDFNCTKRAGSDHNCNNKS